MQVREIVIIVLLIVVNTNYYRCCVMGIFCDSMKQIRCNSTDLCTVD